MSQMNPQNISPLPAQASAAITLNRFVVLNTGNANKNIGVTQMAAATAAQPFMGVAQDMQTSPCAALDSISVQNYGTALVEAGAAVSLGAIVTSDSVGRAVTAASTNLVCGVALEAAGGAGELIQVALQSNPAGKVVV